MIPPLVCVLHGPYGVSRALIATPQSEEAWRRLPRVLNHISSAAQRSLLDRATTQLVQATGTLPCWFRPPGGSLSSSTVACAVSRHLHTAGWSVDTNDWVASKKLNAPGRAMVRRTALAGGRQSHSVVLMHDGGHQRPDMVAELPGTIRYHRDPGYRFVDLAGHSGLKPLPPSRIDYRKSPGVG